MGQRASKFDAKKARERFDSAELCLPGAVLKISFSIDRKKRKVMCLGGRDGQCTWEERDAAEVLQFADNLTRMLRS